MSAVTQTGTPATEAALKQAKPSREGGAGGAGWFARIVVAILCFLWVLPVVGLVITSFRPLDDVDSSGWWNALFNPDNWSRFTIDNYDTAIHQASMGQALVNSVAITLPATFIPILIASFAAYAFTFMEFKGRDFLFLAIVSLLVIPNYVAFVPIINFYQALGISGLPRAWLAHVGFGMSLAIYILRNYMATLPKTVIESAKIDGASHFQTFYKLVLPMSMPALASFAIFQFLWVWNDLLVALIVLGPDRDVAPVTVALQNGLVGQQGGGWNLVTAGALISMFAPVLVFLFLQRYFVRGLTAGAVKG
jgi:alpha-glucoside transport system permease protein